MRSFYGKFSEKEVKRREFFFRLTCSHTVQPKFNEKLKTVQCDDEKTEKKRRKKRTTVQKLAKFRHIHNAIK